MTLLMTDEHCLSVLFSGALEAQNVSVNYETCISELTV